MLLQRASVRPCPYHPKVWPVYEGTQRIIHVYLQSIQQISVDGHDMSVKETHDSPPSRSVLPGKQCGNEATPFADAAIKSPACRTGIETTCCSTEWLPAKSGSEGKWRRREGAGRKSVLYDCRNDCLPGNASRL
jgi:hypothetical protein